jgi:hypothetical protein
MRRAIMICLSIVPFLGMLGCLPFVNTVEPFVLGMPFIMFWVCLWVVLTSVSLVIVYKLDPDNKGGDAE